MLVGIDLGTFIGLAKSDGKEIQVASSDMSLLTYLVCPLCGHRPTNQRAGQQCGHCKKGVLERKRESYVERFVRMREFLNEHIPNESDVYYEEVLFTGKGSAASHLWGGYLAILLLWCYDHNCSCNGIGVTKIKKKWVGTGAASKEQMLAACAARKIPVVNHNEADAVAVLHYILK